MEHNLDYPAVLKFLKEKNYKRTDAKFIEELLKAKKSEENDKKNELIKKNILKLKKDLYNKTHKIEKEIIGALLLNSSLIHLFRYDFLGIKGFFTLEKHHIILKIIFKAIKEKNPFPRLPVGYEEYVELAKKSNSTEMKEFERRCKILHDYANRRAWFEYALDIIAFVLTYSHDLSANPYQKFEYKKSSPVIPNLIVEQ